MDNYFNVKFKRTLKYVGIMLIIFIFTFSILILPAGRPIYSDQAKIRVFIDPGHGGADPGAVANGLLEKNVNIAIALKLKNKLEAGGFEVVMRRTGDQYKTLDEIVAMANSSGADIFISIHNNASISSSANGTETYWNSNGVNGSNQLANLVQSKLVGQIGRYNRGVKTANFRVIKYTQMPAALVECAFVSNPQEAELLKTDSFQEKIATGLYTAINQFSQGINKETGFYTDNSGTNSAGITMYIDYPRNDSIYNTNFNIWGWAANTSNRTSTGVSKIEVFDGSDRNSSSYLGKASSFERTELAEEWGNPGLKDSGYTLNIDINKLSKGEHNIYVYAFDANNNYNFVSVKVNIIKPEEDQSQDGETEESGTEQAENLIPVAGPGGPYEAEVDEVITFDGSSSTDSDGQITEYNWDFGDETAGTGVNQTHFYTEAGTYTVSLIVKDEDNGVSEAATTTVTVTEAAAEESGEDEDSGDSGSSNEGSGTETNKPDPLPYDTPTSGSNSAGLTMYIDRPIGNTSIDANFRVWGWAANMNNRISSGVRRVDIHDGPGRSADNFLGSAGTMERLELAQIMGNPGLKDSGYCRTVEIDRLSAGEHTLYVYAYDSNWNYSVRTVKVNIIKEEEETGSGDTSGDTGEEQATSGNTAVISNNTSIVGYTTVTVDQLVQLFINRNSNKTEWARRLAGLYIQYGQYFNIRADIAWAQMCHETGFLEYTGDVSPEQNNFAGIGATGGVPGNSFTSEELGVIAHYAHLAWYYYPDHVNEYCNNQYDPRHFGTAHYNYNGDITLNHLNGRWAPGSTYTNKIILFVNEIYGN